MSQKPLRKVWIFIPHLTEMSQLKKDDVFMIQPADETDTQVEPGILWLASEDAKPIVSDRSTHECFAYPLNKPDRKVKEPLNGTTKH